MECGAVGGFGLMSFAHSVKTANVKIYGHLGQLGKHEKLIKKLEKVLFN